MIVVSHTAREIYVSTHTQHLYNQTWFSVVGKTSARLSVMACSDVHLALANIPGEGDTRTYEITLGGWANTKSVIKERPTVSIVLIVLL